MRSILPTGSFSTTSNASLAQAFAPPSVRARLVCSHVSRPARPAEPATPSWTRVPLFRLAVVTWTVSGRQAGEVVGGGVERGRDRFTFSTVVHRAVTCGVVPGQTVHPDIAEPSPPRPTLFLSLRTHCPEWARRRPTPRLPWIATTPRGSGCDAGNMNPHLT